MEYLENNHVVFDNNSRTKVKFLYGKIKNTTNDLQKVFGFPIVKNSVKKWKFKMNNAKFIIFNKKHHDGWFFG